MSELFLVYKQTSAPIQNPCVYTKGLGGGGQPCTLGKHLWASCLWVPTRSPLSRGASGVHELLCLTFLVCKTEKLTMPLWRAAPEGVFAEHSGQWLPVTRASCVFISVIYPSFPALSPILFLLPISRHNNSFTQPHSLSSRKESQMDILGFLRK